MKDSSTRLQEKKLEQVSFRKLVAGWESEKSARWLGGFMEEKKKKRKKRRKEREK